MRINYDQLAKIWRASARDSHLSREDLKSVEIDSATNALLASAEGLSLRAEGHFVYGISQIWNSKTRLLLQDSQKTDENIGTAFREYLQALARSNLSQNTTQRGGAHTDLQLSDELTIPDSLLFGRQNAKRRMLDGDLSVDAIMRDGEDMPDELSEGENVPRSAADEAVLEGLDFGLDADLDNGPAFDLDSGPGNLDFGSDLPYSSSPPHTPQNAELDDVEIDGNSSPQAREVAKPVSRRRRGAPIDEIISIVRPKKATSRIQRELPRPKQVEEVAGPSEFYIPLDEATEKLLDPDFIQEEMRRRRRIEAGEEMEVDTAEEEDVQFGMLDLGEDLSLGGLDDLEDDEEEEEDTQEMLETEQRKARDVVRQNLRKRGDRVVFEDLAETPKAKACTLMEILSQAARGRLRPEQTEAWGPITVVRA